MIPLSGLKFHFSFLKHSNSTGFFDQLFFWRPPSFRSQSHRDDRCPECIRKIPWIPKWFMHFLYFEDRLLKNVCNALLKRFIGLEEPQKKISFLIRKTVRFMIPAAFSVIVHRQIVWNYETDCNLCNILFRFWAKQNLIAKWIPGKFRN